MRHDEIMKAFRQQYKTWAKKEFTGGLKEAGKYLGISYRTMERL
jgi:molybdenum-dependent DNA-binding transcriptional regulator ModE